MHSSETIKVVPARYPLRVVGALVALLVLAVVIQSVAFNPRWEWGVFARWFFDPVILEGLGQTLLLTLLGTVLSVIFGGLLALEWGAYLLLDFFYSYTIAKEKGWKFLPVEIILYPAFHFAYGFGSLCGIAALPKFVRAEKEKKKAGDGR